MSAGERSLATSILYLLAAAEPEPGAAYALAGCGVSPGFEYDDFELAQRQALLAEYPAQRELVLRFTRTPEEPAWP